MLVITRRVGEGMVHRCACGCESRLWVQEVRGAAVRLAFDAPLDAVELRRVELEPQGMRPKAPDVNVVRSA